MSLMLDIELKIEEIWILQNRSFLSVFKMKYCMLISEVDIKIIKCSSNTWEWVDLNDTFS